MTFLRQKKLNNIGKQENGVPGVTNKSAHVLAKLLQLILRMWSHCTIQQHPTIQATSGYTLRRSRGITIHHIWKGTVHRTLNRYCSASSSVCLFSSRWPSRSGYSATVAAIHTTPNIQKARQLITVLPSQSYKIWRKICRMYMYFIFRSQLGREYKRQSDIPRSVIYPTLLGTISRTTTSVARAKTTNSYVPAETSMRMTDFS